MTDEPVKHMSSFDPRLACCPSCHSAEVHFMDVWQFQNGAPVQFHPIRCADCGIRTSESFETEAEAISVWNDLSRPRVHGDSVQVAIDELRST